MLTYSGHINKLGPNEIFVFGSNPEGIHGRGAAKIALEKYGAIYGQGHGLQGNSYGLVTKNLTAGYYDCVTGITYEKAGIRSISRNQLTNNIKKLYEVATSMSAYKFYVAYTAKGTNLCGYTSNEMAQMFHDAGSIPRNIIFEDNFSKLITAIKQQTTHQKSLFLA